jgi:hypothetical protein
MSREKGSALNPIQFEQMVMAVRGDMECAAVLQNRFVAIPNSGRVTGIRQVISELRISVGTFIQSRQKAEPIVESCSCCHVSSNLAS